MVAGKLRLRWSPEQIAGWLKHVYPRDKSQHVSHETIYRSLFIQSRGALKKELLEHLRRLRGMRRSRHCTQKTGIHGQIVDAVSISDRPASVEDRAVPGHWEGDLVFGSANSQIATLVERQSRYVMLVKLEGKDSQTVVNALIKNARKLPQELYKSLTWDRGTEMHGHKRFTMAIDIQVYFCDPQSPWQRGSNENTNGLLRQYMPKGIDWLAENRHFLGSTDYDHMALGWFAATIVASCYWLFRLMRWIGARIDRRGQGASPRDKEMVATVVLPTPTQSLTVPEARQALPSYCQKLLS